MLLYEKWKSLAKAGPVRGIFHRFHCKWSHHMRSCESVAARGGPPTSQRLGTCPRRASRRMPASLQHETM